MTLLDYLEHKLSPAEYKYCYKLYREETDIFMQTLERFRKYFKEELKVMNEDITDINGFGRDE